MKWKGMRNDACPIAVTHIGFMVKAANYPEISNRKRIFKGPPDEPARFPSGFNNR